MTQATDIVDPATAAKRRNTVVWVIGLCLAGLIFDGYDLVVYGAVLPTFYEPGGLIFNALPEHQAVLTDLANGVIDKADPAAAAAVGAANGIGGTLGSLALIGVMVGALLAGSVGDILGRRKIMLGSLAWFSLGMFITSFMTTSTSFGVMRFITGLGIGTLVATTGAVVSEFAPPGKKQLANAIVYSGVPLGSLLSALLAIILLDALGWEGMMRIGALPFITLLPLAIWKLPESVPWLASRGRLEEAQRISATTGIPVPEAPPIAKDTETKAPGGRVGWAGLFGDFPVATIILGVMGVCSLLLVYSLNTWLPRLMQPLLGQSGSLALLLVLNGGAVLGALFGSRFADRFGPQPTVAVCFAIGAVSLFFLTLVPSDTAWLWLLLIVIALVGLGTSGTQTLSFGFVANYFPTRVRGAAVAWAAGFGRLGGVFGPILGGVLATAFLGNLDAVFWVLSGIGVVGMVLCLIVPKRKAERIESLDVAPTAPAGATPMSDVPRGEHQLYGKILVTVDALGNELTRRRVTEFVKLNGTKAYLGYIADERITVGDTISSDSLAEGGGDARVTDRNITELQEYVDRLTAEGVSAQGVIISAGEHDRGDKIVSLADELGVDLVILNFERGGARAKARTAQQILHHNPRLAVLIARPTTDAVLV